MPIRLYPPGSRKNNRWYIARVTSGGRRLEVSTKTTDRAAAGRFARELADRLGTGDSLPHRVTFSDAADRCADSRRFAQPERWRLERIKAIMGNDWIDLVDHERIAQVAHTLYPGDHQAASRNRNVATTIASVLHFAAEKGWRGPFKMRREREQEPRTRALDPKAAARLIDSAPDAITRALLIILFRQGLRISDTLRLDWSDIDLDRATAQVQIRKIAARRIIPLHHDTVTVLRPLARADGRVFPWRDRWRVYDVLKPICDSAGVAFTPHMARHSRAAWLADAGASLRTIMDAGVWRDHRSCLRYQGESVARVRAADAGLPPLLPTPKPAPDAARKPRRRANAG